MSSNGLFSEMFGHLSPGMCRLGINGQIAVKTNSGYKTYDVEKNRLTNVGQFAFDVGADLFFVVPTTKVKPGDILLIDGKPKCVISNTDNKTIKVMSYEDSTIQEILPERHMFLGQMFFYRKIVSMFGNDFLKGEKGFGKIMKIMMMREMVGGSGLMGGNNSGGNSMMQMMMMSQLMGGSENAFADMFNLDFDFEDPDDVESDKPEKVKSK